MDGTRVVQGVSLVGLHVVHGRQPVDVWPESGDESAAADVEAENHVAENPGVHVKVEAENHVAEESAEAEIHVVEDPGADAEHEEAGSAEPEIHVVDALDADAQMIGSQVYY
jgi:hypothetical protein